MVIRNISSTCDNGASAKSVKQVAKQRLVDLLVAVILLVPAYFSTNRNMETSVTMLENTRDPWNFYFFWLLAANL